MNVYKKDKMEEVLKCKKKASHLMLRTRNEIECLINSKISGGDETVAGGDERSIPSVFI